MSLQRIILLIVTALYFWLCHVFIHKICTECDCENSRQKTEEAISSTGAAATESTTTANSKILEPIVFNWDSSDAITSDKFADYKANILTEMEDGKTLEVYGYYFQEEKAPDGYANMGLARADELINLLAETIPKEKMTPRARLIDEKDGVRDHPFISTRYRWVDAAPEATDDSDAAPKEDVARVDEVEDRALIYFPFNSVKKEINSEVDAYLDKLANRLKASNESVVLTGHTDDIGSEVSNYGLAERRAKMIRDILRKKGVSSSKITTKSEGESQPTAPNDTDANRRLNRRVEVKVN